MTARSAAHTENEPDFDQAFDRFAQRHSLTHRERDVVRLALQGSPTSHIAGQLHLSAGSVRNHRSHVYAKLDITTERELFRMFLSELLTRPS